jgi:hypothetical protein
VVGRPLLFFVKKCLSRKNFFDKINEINRKLVSILGRISDLVLNREFKGRKFALESIVFLNTLALLPTTAFANTDSLGGVPDSSSAVSDAVDTTNTITREQANNILQNVRDAIPEPSKDRALDQINKAVNTSRDSSWDMAMDALAPVGYGLMFLANILWGLATFGYFFQTSVDVLCLVWSGPREYFMNKQPSQDQGFSLKGFIGSFFTLSYDARQIIESAGLSTGSQQMQGAGGMGMNRGGMGMGAPMGSPMGMNRGMGMGGMNQGMQNKPMVSTGNLLSRYVSLHMKTLVALGVAFVIFGTSFATEFQGQAVSLIIALIKGAWNLLLQGFRFISGRG